MNDSSKPRTARFVVRLTDDEAKTLARNMKLAGITNREAYVRKMVLDGFIIKRDYSHLKKAVSEVHRLGNNVNQIAHIANSFHDIRSVEIKRVQEGVDAILRLLTLKG